MKLTSDDKSIASNVEGAKQFGISTNSAKLFSMLSTALYTNKELAVLNELGANCHDEHIAANVTKPWDLVLPTTLDPYIKFRDYGRGLSEENVYKLLTTYGESTKSDSNDFIGAYGIGSKSPAAVTSTWNVVSRYNNVLTEYLVFIDRTGIPSITKLRSEKCDDSGLEVIIPINPNRQSIWHNLVVDAYEHYSKKPNVVNAKINWREKQKSLKFGKDWELFGVNEYSYSNSSNISFIISNREYGVDAQTIRSEFKDADFLSLLQYKMHVYFNIGELDISLSREQIQYTPHSLQVIKAKLQHVHKEIASSVKKFLSSAKDGLEYRELVKKAGKEFFGVHNVRTVLRYISGNKYGVKNEGDVVDYSFVVKDFASKKFRVMAGSSNQISLLTDKYTCHRTHAIKSRTNLGSTESIVAVSLNHLEKFKIVIDNVRGAANRIRHSLKGNLVLISNENCFPSEFQRFVVLASSLEKPAKTSREKRSKEALIWGIKRNSFSKIQAKALDKNGKFAYVSFTKATTKASMTTPHGEELIRIANKRGYFVVGVKEGDTPPSFIKPIEDVILSDFEKINTEEFVSAHALADIGHEISNSYNSIAVILKNGKVKTPNHSIWNEMVEETQKILTAYRASVKKTDIQFNNDYRFIVEVGSLLDIPLAKSSDSSYNTISNILETVYNNYPMLKYSNDRIPASELIQYINQVGV